MTPVERKRLADSDLLGVMRTPNGRRTLWRLLVQSGMFGTSFVLESPMGTAYNEGRRAVGLALLAELQRVCPEEYVLAFNEAANEKALEDMEGAAG